MACKILIADDHTMVRESLSSLLRNESDIEVVGEADNGRAAVELTCQLKPQVVIMDISMPELNGIEATRQIVHQIPETKVIALSGYTDRKSVYEALRAGAAGYVTKQCAFQELVKAIHTVLSNQVYISSQVSSIVVDGYINHNVNDDGSSYSLLTSREREVLQLISEGKSTKIIAKELHVSTKTIEWHRSQLMKKLRIESVAELVKYAIREGLTCVEM